MPRIDTEKYRLIRRLYTVDGLSQRQIALQLGISRDSVKKYCEGKTIPQKHQERIVEKSELRVVLEAEIIRLISENKDAPKKQRLNAKIIWENLIDDGYRIGASTIRKYIQEMRIDKPDIFIPIEHEPGETMEFDWGDAYAYINKVKTKVSVFCAVLPYSYGIFAGVFPDKKYSSFFMGHVMAFEYFKGVPVHCLYDNLKTAILDESGKDAIKQEKFKKFEAHYAFESIFCNAKSGWEKGSVENLVSVIRQIAFTPMPWVENYQDLQEHVTHKCIQYCMNHKIKGRARPIREMLEEEKEHLLPLPVYRMDTAEEVKATVHSDLTVRVGTVKYSVPAEYVGLTVTVKISPFNIDIYHMGNLVFCHKKGRHQQDHQYITEHYLEILQRKPRAIKNAIPITKGIMPKELQLFLKLCKDRDKNVQLVNILLLAKKIDSDTLLWAVSQSNLTGTPSYDRVCFYIEIGRRKDDPPQVIPAGININPADLSQYDQLIGRSKNTHDENNPE